MDINDEIKDTLGLKKLDEIPNSVANGCISSGRGFHTEKGDIFVKNNKGNDALSMFVGEFNSLNAIRLTKTINAPKPLGIVQDPKSPGGAIVLDYHKMTRVTNWLELGSQLADLHLFNSVLEKMKSKQQNWIGRPPKSDTPFTETVFKKEIKFKIDDEAAYQLDYVDQFGFEGATFCGKIAQNNEWHDNWIEFYARNRLDYQINLVIEKSGDREIIEYWSNLQLTLDRLFKEMRNPIKPSLLHGDLWSGNVSQVNDTPIIYDPASFYGHSEFELSITSLFCGFADDFYDSYFKKIPKEEGYEMRQELYKLFHTLNHWNHFGNYKRRTKDIMKKLIQYCTN